ncbi:hypothetical protein [Nocardia gipuzkoensis]
MASQLKLFERCPPELLRSGGAERPVEPCSADDGGVRSGHPDDHARISVSGTGLATWPTAQRLLAASAPLAAAADHAESVATDIYRSATDDPLLRQVIAQFLRRFPRWNYLPVLPARPGRDWRLLLEDAAHGLPPTASPAHLDMKGPR